MSTPRPHQAHANHAQDTSGSVLSVRSLSKTFRTGFRRKRVQVVSDVSFDVQPGEVFGFLGPNGAGKTTTIKMAMGLIRPSSGEIRLFGGRHDDIRVRARIGFLPEQPYFYDYLDAAEILDFFGRLYGLDAATRRKRIDTLLERLGLGHARDRTLRKFSKGMLQRVGIAQALIGNPELVVLDEPLSGLDPIGRKEIRDLLAELRDEGRTVFLSSHILTDIESLCDRVAIIVNGRVVRTGRLTELLEAHSLQTDIEARGVPDNLQDSLRQRGVGVERLGEGMRIRARGPAEPVLQELITAGATIVAVHPRRGSLEGLFMELAERRPAANTTGEAV